MPEGAQGRIVRVVAGFYDVDLEGRTVRCRARGVLKKRGIHPVVGDAVRVRLSGPSEGVVEDVLSRTNVLVRPPVANVDLAVLVFSIREPDLNRHLLDRLLVSVELQNIPALLCWSKADLLQDRSDFEREVSVYGRLGYPTLFASSLTGEGIDALRTWLRGKVSVLAGQSGVGKSSLINALRPGLNRAVGDVSRRLGRGRHTTRQVELLRLEENTYVVDTPGFGVLAFDKDLEPERLPKGFPELVEVGRDCRYRGCLHEEEEGCAVPAALAEGRIDPLRYDHYREWLKELREAREERYR
ncbi:ribosome small subunit-dependent GTPase A [Kyrpidia spormannii]|uniref:GTPase involved in ribosome biogenesis n=2 Tax=Kyrpidia spormannii TaxID=2055160 RepID=A0ACA8Z9D5_9BACL|nr:MULTISPECIES: ribosome small subunit-dependent GTPase A [Kyrpidia]ATY85091.1 ribosome small subunit-dependent GTPase A [Kyrpidia spormannii]CAB3392678.1 GTPase involved in ribosome biogenesis [Kyrpidia spormannii]